MINKESNSSWSLSNHWLIVFISTLAAIITIIVFFTGTDGIQKILQISDTLFNYTWPRWVTLIASLVGLIIGFSIRGLFTNTKPLSEDDSLNQIIVQEYQDRVSIKNSGKQTVYYPVTFTKKPTLKIYVKQISDFTIVEERCDGFVVYIKGLYATSLFDYMLGRTHDLIWSAKGTVDIHHKDV